MDARGSGQFDAAGTIGAAPRREQGGRSGRGTRPGRDAAGLLAVLVPLALLLLFRWRVVEPRAWGAACAAASAPWACLPRALLLQLQAGGLWGAAALGLGLWAFLRGPFPVCVAAVGFGAAAVANYNAGPGVLGAALGAWAWMRRDFLR